MIDNIEIQNLIKIARKAGNEILRIYNDENASTVVDHKDDNSPLTLADKASHKVIEEGLTKLYPNIPIISEEGNDISYETRKHWNTFWLVDPLDGTKEFINRNGEFTVNIALIENRRPVLGIVFTPVKNEVYYGSSSIGAFKIEGSDGPKTIIVNNTDENRVAVRSKSHASIEEEALLKRYKVVDSISVGSSLKFCMVAEGKADIYYRHGPTMEWDTAAGQAVVEAAGGKVYVETSSQMFTYNKENLLNTGFLCLGF
ncbi:3'(2'),5'-bisphosphate nucleotidase CysQ [Fulvivirgaceae bacterium BMA10]|uniref:3'(2'),5'-bisphosphate nucleotidase CysQ n=1 Tax=Splendidivirga corallicola TaxID=3051826 RepID=A0ABT8KTG8_9BACT|nr:3'(2'),5'-bisphosphate nucleotidase CysQ [Fulvivirgaceae bacterium BMA10]